MRKLVVALFSIALIFCSSKLQAQKGREFYLITVYHFNNNEQEKTIDDYLQNAYLPALHKKGIKQVGVFKSRTNDTVNDKRAFVFIPLKNIEEFANLTSKMLEDQQYLEKGKGYLDAPYNNTPYARMENILLRAFPLAPKMNLPNLKSAKSDRVYELRSYEGGTEKLFRNKVEMFNQGGEIKLFERLNFNAVFYAEVLSGSRMPNLMYMTTFENIADRDAHWKTFGQDAEWKTISALPQYQKNVSKSDIMLLTPTDYSDF
jgi:hypothetical protein